jgi:hypothetical protein
MALRIIESTLEDQIRATMWTENSIAPAQIANRCKTLGVIDEMLDIDHKENPQGKELEGGTAPRIPRWAKEGGG